MENEDEIIAIGLPKKLVEEWKFLVQVRQQVEGQVVDPVEVLRQAISTEAHLWLQKTTAKNARSTRSGGITGLRFFG